MSGTRQTQFTVSGQSTDWKDPDAARVYIERIMEPVFKRVRNTVNQLARDVLSVATSTLVDAKYGLVLVNATAGPVTLTIPAPDAMFHPLVVVKTDASANAVTVQARGGALISGAATDTVRARWDVAAYEGDEDQYIRIFVMNIGVGQEGQVYLTRDSTAQWGYAPFQWIDSSGNITAPYNSVISMNTLTSVATVKLPSDPRNGEFVRIIARNAGDYNITVDGNGHNIDNGFYAAAASTTIGNNGQQVLYGYDSGQGVWRVMSKYIPRLSPRLNTHGVDSNTVALWQGDPPGNGGSGLVDSSGNGLTLEVVGTAGYGELGYGQEGFALDGTNYWRRAGTANDAILNTTFSGDHTIEMLVRPTSQPNGMTCFDYGAPTAGTADTDALANINLKLANAGGGPNVASSTVMAYFYQTGAGVNHSVVDTKIFPINQPQHIAAVYSGSTILFYVNGFLQSTAGGQTARSAMVTPAQYVHIGADHNAAFFFTGFIGSIKVSNVARSAASILEDAARCLGMGERLIP